MKTLKVVLPTPLLCPFKIIIRERTKLQDKYYSYEKSIFPPQLSVLRSMLSLDRHQNP